jgi:hypothetical protein
MHVRDFLNPDTAMRWAWKMFLAILALLLFPSLLEKLGELLGIVIGLLMLAAAAAHVRGNSGGGRRETARNTGGAERTPVLPQIEDHE